MLGGRRRLLHRHALEHQRLCLRHLDLLDILALLGQGRRLCLRLRGVLRPLPRWVSLLQAFSILLVLAYVQHVLLYFCGLLAWRWVLLSVQRRRHFLTRPARHRLRLQEPRASSCAILAFSFIGFEIVDIFTRSFTHLGHRSQIQGLLLLYLER